MQKFYAYIGLVVAVALAVFLLYPAGSDYPVDATPFDNDVVSAAMQRASGISKFMDEMSGGGPDILFIYNHRAQLVRYIPDIEERLEAYLGADSAESPLLTALQADVMMHYAELLAQYKSSYAMLTYISHVVIFFILIAMLWKRRVVGHAIAATAAAPVRLTGKGLAAFHRRV